MTFHLKKILYYACAAMACVAAVLFAGVNTVQMQSEQGSATVDATVPVICGNSAIEGSEQCDDGNTTNGDGCSSICKTEGGGGGILPTPPGGGGDTGTGDTGDTGDGTGDTGTGDGGDTGEGDGAPDGEEGEGEAGDGDGAGDAEDGEDAGDGDSDPGAGDGDAGPPDAGDGDGDGGPGDSGAPPGGSDGGPAASGDGGGGLLPATLDVNDVRFAFVRSGLSVAIQNNRIRSLTGEAVRVSVVENEQFRQALRSLTLRASGRDIPFTFIPSGMRFDASFTTPDIGTHGLSIVAQYQDGRSETVRLSLESIGFGQITESGGNTVLRDVRVFLRTQTGEVWNAGTYSQTNPVQSQGTYAFLVPDGIYQLVFQKEGYHERRTLTFSVTDHIVNRSIGLVKQVPDVRDVIDPNASAGQNALNVIKNIGEQAREQAQLLKERLVDTAIKVDEIADNPQVERATERVVAPAVITVSVIAITPSLWSILVPLLRFLFLQPLLLLGRRKRTEWGQVYNALTKLPIDLATVRLLDANTKRILHSRVTDGNGRYLFIVEPGAYIIDVVKPGLLFPTHVLRDVKNDGRLTDLYHGERIEAKEEGVSLTPNVPVDPTGATKTPKRIVWEKRARAAQHIISLFGIGATLLSLYITPAPVIWAFLGVHIVFYVLFLRYVRPKRPKGWGIVYEEKNNKPLGKVVARLFTKQYNKLVASEVTDSRGRYSFLAGPNEYYVTYEKPGYQMTKVEHIALKDGEAGLIKEDVKLAPLKNTSGTNSPST